MRFGKTAKHNGQELLCRVIQSPYAHHARNLRYDESGNDIPIERQNPSRMSNQNFSVLRGCDETRRTPEYLLSKKLLNPLHLH